MSFKDISGSMGDDYVKLKEELTTAVPKLLDDGSPINDVAFLTYSDTLTGEPTTVVINSDNATMVNAAISGVTLLGGGDCPETALDGLAKGIIKR